MQTIDWNKIPLKISNKVAVGVLRDSREFPGDPYQAYRAHRAVILALAYLSGLKVQALPQSHRVL